MRSKHKRNHSGWTGNVHSRDVGAQLRLVPFWERGLTTSSRLEVIIDPGPSFGAGDHPTTIMALELLEEVLADEQLRGTRPHLLDVGTGTGVLAIAAVLLGADFAVGSDIDEVAVFTARRNLSLNGLIGSGTDTSPVQLFLGRLDAVRGPFDIVAANLAAPTLLRLLVQITEQTGRFLVLSGIADAMADQVIHEYASRDLTLLSRSQEDGWNAALFARQ